MFQLVLLHEGGILQFLGHKTRHHITLYYRAHGQTMLFFNTVSVLEFLLDSVVKLSLHKNRNIIESIIKNGAVVK